MTLKITNLNKSQFYEGNLLFKFNDDIELIINFSFEHMPMFDSPRIEDGNVYGIERIFLLNNEEKSIFQIIGECYYFNDDYKNKIIQIDNITQIEVFEYLNEVYKYIKSNKINDVLLNGYEKEIDYILNHLKNNNMKFLSYTGLVVINPYNFCKFESKEKTQLHNITISVGLESRLIESGEKSRVNDWKMKFVKGDENARKCFDEMYEILKKYENKVFGDE